MQMRISTRSGTCAAAAKKAARAAPLPRTARVAAALPPASESSATSTGALAAAAAAVCTSLALLASPFDAYAAQRTRQPPVGTESGRCSPSALDLFAGAGGAGGWAGQRFSEANRRTLDT
jgi:hypothetical protein